MKTDTKMDSGATNWYECTACGQAVDPVKRHGALMHLCNGKWCGPVIVTSGRNEDRLERIDDAIAKAEGGGTA